ncbi:unannotated protein [freshwater metagenome]|jgi:hypothetical protein|uniref:Unannotated protein n=1 Tax=freshwater metagenome TaxID=449393 RepID=A0A6J7IH52_9ZZZZ|nr:hypothetical protein [Actinomycetota bacterium]
MGLAIVVTFALCLWIVLWSIGAKSFDGALLALIIVVVGAGARALLARRDPQD